MITFDTNVLVYALADRTGDPREGVARKCIAQAALVRSIVAVQVLSEFLNVCRNKRLAASGQARIQITKLLDIFPTAPTTTDTVIAASILSERYGLQYFDALIVTVVAGAGATTLLTEDMQDGQTIAGVTILNPFVPHNADRLAALLRP